jgi:hypothetical protein
LLYPFPYLSFFYLPAISRFGSGTKRAILAVSVAPPNLRIANLSPPVVPLSEHRNESVAFQGLNKK